MAFIPQRELFSWKEIENLGDLERLKLVLEHLPEEPLMQRLEAERGNGRDDWPVRAVWNSILAGVVYQHASVQSLRRELSRNPQLRWLCGFDVTRPGKQVAPASTYTRLLEDRRVFTPVARSSYKWKDIYNKRTAAERVNSRLDVSYGFEQHFIRGLAKMRMRMGLAMLVMLSMAVGRIKEKQKEHMRSLLQAA